MRIEPSFLSRGCRRRCSHWGSALSPDTESATAMNRGLPSLQSWEKCLLFISHPVDGIFAPAAQMDYDESSRAVINFNQRIEESLQKTLSLNTEFPLGMWRLVLVKWLLTWILLDSRDRNPSQNSLSKYNRKVELGTLGVAFASVLQELLALFICVCFPLSQSRGT